MIGVKIACSSPFSLTSPFLSFFWYDADNDNFPAIQCWGKNKKKRHINNLKLFVVAVFFHVPRKFKCLCPCDNRRVAFDIWFVWVNWPSVWEQFVKWNKVQYNAFGVFNTWCWKVLGGWRTYVKIVEILCGKLKRSTVST